MPIITGTNYGDPRKQASQDTPHGLTPQTIDALGDRMEKFLPGLAGKHGNASEQFFDGLLPDGATLDSRTASRHQRQANIPCGVSSNQFGFNSGVNMTLQRPYQPEFESPDRQQYPVHRILANRYWRLFYKLDPVIGNCIDMYRSMPWSDFQLSGEGITGEIKEKYEDMCSDVNLLRILEYMVSEFMVVGECCPHCFFDDAKGIWTYIALHNPDQLEVIDTPFIKMDPVVEFIPDDRLRAVLTSNNHLLRRIREQMPQELISRLIARQNIPLSPVNMTFIPRRLHPYDTRGTSIISRMWRILMYEDAIYNASIATARRHAGPLKVAKLGNPQTGWIPSQDHEQKLLRLLAQAELDVNAWLVYHYGINFELVGTTDRVMNISQHHDVIERIKLIAMGISKAFLHGEVTYASSITGLSVFLQRMKSVRNFFVNTWILPKLFKPIAKINGWVRRNKNEINYRYRIKRSVREIEEEGRWLIPSLEWEKQLDHTVNSELITAMNTLETGLGIKFSDTTKYSTVGRKFEDELRKIKDEQQFKKQLNVYIPPQTMAGGPGKPGGAMPPMPAGRPPAPPVGGSPLGPGGAPGSAPKPRTPGAPSGMGTPPAAPPGLAGVGEMPPAAVADKEGDGGGSGPSGKIDPAVIDMNSTVWDQKGRYKNWDASEIEELIRLIREGHTNSPLWDDLRNSGFVQAVNSNDQFAMLDELEDFLLDRGYPISDIRDLRSVLDQEGILKDIATGDVGVLRELEGQLESSDLLKDDDVRNRMSATLSDQRPEIVKVQDSDMLLVGHGNEPWSGDISGVIGDR